MNNIAYRRLNTDQISSLKDMWLRLNAYHIPIVTTFKDRFKNVSFEDHVQQLLLTSDSIFAYTANKNDQTVGFILVFTNGDTAEIDSIFIEEAYRQQGIGTSLMQSALKELKGVYNEIIMKVAEGNIQPFHFANHFKKRYVLFQYDYADTDQDSSYIRI